jgi:protein-disulfide isomerase
MLLSRRSLLLAAPFVALAPLSGLDPGIARAAEDARMAERAIGAPDAKVTVQEWFSLTCPHCARFARDTFPKIRKELAETGKIRYVFRDFPLDQVALMAAMVARALPPERYETFVLALFNSQDRWAFARDVNNTEEIWKMAALAGMSRAMFDATIADTGLRDAILNEQDRGEKEYRVNSTPTFVFSGPGDKRDTESGEISYDAFVKAVGAVGGAV